MTNEDDEVQAAELARLESLIELIITQDDERGLALIPARIVAEVRKLSIRSGLLTRRSMRVDGKNFAKICR